MRIHILYYNAVVVTTTVYVVHVLVWTMTTTMRMIKHIRKMKTIQSLNILVYNHAINVTLHAVNLSSYRISRLHCIEHCLNKLLLFTVQFFFSPFQIHRLVGWGDIMILLTLYKKTSVSTGEVLSILSIIVSHGHKKKWYCIVRFWAWNLLIRMA